MIRLTSDENGTKKLLGALCLARRAGKLAIGFDAAHEAVKRKSPLALAACDAAERTVRNLELEQFGVKLLVIPLTQQQLEQSIGRKFAVAAVTDPQLAILVQNSAIEGGCI